ncbi:hypothetical protein BGY98DRAFT_935049 [Russula aff. rugulosa BPL654]|nr:hypothetical protein BGY98DRAFT_935049 [Russula aff. rugulosa BPL654]
MAGTSIPVLAASHIIARIDADHDKSLSKIEPQNQSTVEYGLNTAAKATCLLAFHWHFSESHVYAFYSLNCRLALWSLYVTGYWLNSQAGVDTVKKPEDAMSPMTTLGKRVGDWEKLWQLEVLRQPKSQYYSKLWESSRPQLPAPPGGWTDVSQPLPSIPEEPSPPLMSKISKFLMSKLAK